MNKPVMRTAAFAGKFLRSTSFQVAFMLLCFSSCFVRSPKYTTLEQVMTLQVGMTKVQVEEILGVQPYNLKARTDTGDVYIYVYRVNDRRTISFATKPVNGKELEGNYVQLAVAYSKSDKVLNIESCNLCPANLVSTSKVNIPEVLVFLTVTLPLLLLYFK